MKIVKLILLTILLLPNNCFSQSLFSKVFGAKDYDECILLRIDSNTNAVAAKLIQKSCRNKFPKTPTPIKKEDQPQKIPDHIVKEKLGGKAKLHWSKTNESVDASLPSESPFAQIFKNIARFFAMFLGKYMRLFCDYFRPNRPFQILIVYLYVLVTK